MSDKKKLGQDPAHPSKHININGSYDRQYKGVSKRVYIATAAMQGFLSNPLSCKKKSNIFIRIWQNFFPGTDLQWSYSNPDEIVRASLEFADELLNQENKES
jgi:hypothetical protein